MSRKFGLGRGLNQLFKENYTFDEHVKENETIVEINLFELKENPYQPRKTFDEEKIEELAQSIKEHGVLQPIIVKKSEIGYYIVAGERRYRACKKLGLATIPAIVRDIDDQIMAEFALLENLQRENLTILEEALAYQMLINKHHLTQQEVAERVGKSRSHITNAIRLLSLPETIQELLKDEQLEFGHAKVLAGVKDEDKMVEYAKQVHEQGLSVRALERLIKDEDNNDEWKQPTTLNKKPRKELNVHLQHVQEHLIERLGTAVKIQPKDKGGKIIIDFENDHDLNRLLEVMHFIETK